MPDPHNDGCPFCEKRGGWRVELDNEQCEFLRRSHPVLHGSGIIVPRRHCATVFDLTPEEWTATFELLRRAKAHLDETYQPQGYNVGWNCGRAAGQEVAHAHLHVTPRFEDEPLAGTGIRAHLKQPDNARP